MGVFSFARASSGKSDARKGRAVLLDSKVNQGAAFSDEERRVLNLQGLLPAAVESLEHQVKRELAQVRRKATPIDRYEYLCGLLDRNEQLFYRVLVDNVTEIMPYVYTPTVGQACREYGMRWSSPRGLYVTIKDKGHVAQVVANWPEPVVKVIVFTDGERILGLGDLGTNGMGIPVGKLQLYVACGGIDPRHCLPVCIDVGTNNEEYLKDEWYQGLRQKRVRGKEYDELIEEFMAACAHRWGRTLLMQFEDFGNTNAFRLLENARKKWTCFNDDIQGTASVTLGGIMASLPETGDRGGPKTLAEHTFVFLGAGEAGTGIAQLIALAVRIESGGKVSMEQARSKIWLVDSQGLVHAGRKELAHHKQDFAHKLGAAQLAGGEITSLEDAVRVLKPTAVIGVSSMPKTFTPAVLELMAENNAAPLVFALSNPTSQAECTAEECYEGTAGKAIFASGSPFDPVTVLMPNGAKKTFEPAQCNNAYVFPALGLACVACGLREIPDDLMYVAAAALADTTTEADRERGSVCPPLRQIREVSATIAVAVANKAYELKLATVHPQPKNMAAFIREHMFTPGYGDDVPPLRTKSVL